MPDISLKPQREILIITGMSGAGKSQVMKFLEDMGYFCVDNLPPSLLRQFMANMNEHHPDLDKIAVAVDIRSMENLANLTAVLANFKQADYNYRVLFMNACDTVLINRFKASRRPHPLAKDGLGLSGGIIAERKQLEEIKGLADIVLDTSDLDIKQLAAHINDLFADRRSLLPEISLYSFGFKYGLPLDADLVIDVRFLPNPYYIPELKPLTGHDQTVRDYVLKQDLSKEFLRRYLYLLRFLLPQYKKEGKKHLLIAIGCTGGKHRSVAISEELAKRLAKDGYHLIIGHRDIER